MSDKAKLSKHLTDMLSKLPATDWFTIDDLSPAYIYRAQWVLNKLTEAGYLENRVEFINPNWKQDKDFRCNSHYKLKP